MHPALFGFLLALFLAGASLKNSMTIIRQGDQALVEFLGKYEGRKLEPGLTFLTPFLEYVAYRQTLREQILDLPPIPCTTGDRVNITADIVVYWKVLDLEKACYKVEDLRGAMINVLIPQIRTEIARMKLDSLFTARAELNELLVRELDVTTEPWGFKITRVELRDFTIAQKMMADKSWPERVIH